MAIVNLYPDDGHAPESEDVYNTEVAAELAEATQANYERKAAEMHEELVDILKTVISLEEPLDGAFDFFELKSLLERAERL